MSAITETEPGGEMVCILAFSARPRGLDNRPRPGPRREFHLGEHVRFVTSFFKETPSDNPTGNMAIFEPLGEPAPGQYAAHETYFVSLDCWDALREHFRREPSSRNDLGGRLGADQPQSRDPAAHETR